VLLVVGAGDATGREVALRAGALGAAVVVAGPTLAPLLVTAGLVAAAGGDARVVETAAPPLGGLALLEAAKAVLAAPTHAAVAFGAFDDDAAAARARDAVAAALGPARVVALGRRAPEGPRAAAKSYVAALFSDAAAPRGTGDAAPVR
jgi:hypothetical protein